MWFVSQETAILEAKVESSSQCVMFALYKTEDTGCTYNPLGKNTLWVQCWEVQCAALEVDSW